MFDANRVNEILNIVGWRQNPDPQGNQLNEMLEPTTGIYINDEHPLLTYANIYSHTEDFDSYTFTTFDPVKTDYAINDVVDDGSGNLYIRIKIHASAQPVTDPIYWREYDPLTQWLKEKTQAGILQAINDWYSRKAKFNTAINLLSAEMVFPNGGNIEDTDINNTKVVGQRITPKRNTGVLTSISEFSLQLTTDQSVIVKVFQKGIKDPIYSETAVYNKSGGVQWFPVTWLLNPNSEYYICYDSSTLTGNSINSIEYYPYGKYYRIKTFSVESGFTEIFSSDDITTTTSTNYGLNYKISVKCDYTNFIVQQKELFKTICAKRVAILLLRTISFNPDAQENRHKTNVNHAQLIYEIDGDSQSTEGNNNTLNSQYEKALNSIQFDRSEIDNICLPCKKRGVKYGAIK